MPFASTWSISNDMSRTPIPRSPEEPRAWCYLPRSCFAVYLRAPYAAGVVVFLSCGCSTPKPAAAVHSRDVPALDPGGPRSGLGGDERVARCGDRDDDRYRNVGIGYSREYRAAGD